MVEKKMVNVLILNILFILLEGSKERYENNRYDLKDNNILLFGRNESFRILKMEI